PRRDGQEARSYFRVFAAALDRATSRGIASKIPTSAAACRRHAVRLWADADFGRARSRASRKAARQRYDAPTIPTTWSHVPRRAAHPVRQQPLVPAAAKPTGVAPIHRVIPHVDVTEQPLHLAGVGLEKAL